MAHATDARTSTIDEQAIVARIARYSSLRGVERALLPSVRSRRLLPTTAAGTDLLQRLQALLEQVRSGSGVYAGMRQGVEVSLADVDAALERFRRQLLDQLHATPLSQLRSTLPAVVERSRTEVTALLDLCLGSELERVAGEPPYRIDYLVTLLSRQASQGISILRYDPSRVSPGLQARCRMRSSEPCPDCAAFVDLFRQASIEILELDNLGPIIARMREAKSRLGDCFFNADVLRAMVAYNLAAANRFHELFEIAHAADRMEEHSLQALRRGPEGSEPLPTPLPPAAEITRSAMMRTAVLVGLSLRDLPSLASRLRQIEIDAVRGGSDWLRELDRVLEEAILLLTREGRTEDAARLTRMRVSSPVGS